MRKFLLALALAGCATGSAAAVPAPPLRLLVMLKVDGLKSDSLLALRERGGGLSTLAKGTFFSNGTETSAAFPAIADVVNRGSPGSLVVSVAGSRAEATAIGGMAPDQRWYWQGNQFVTDLQSQRPPVVGQANAAIQAMIAKAQPPLLAPPACNSPTSESSAAGNAFGRAAGDTAAFARSPALDGAILALSAALVQQLGLGMDSETDLLTVDLPATAIVGAGLASPTSCLQLHALNRDLGDFLGALDRTGRDYAVVLTGEGPRAPVLLWSKDMTPALRQETVDAADLARTVIGQVGAATTGLATEGACLSGIEGIACPQR